MFRKLRAFFRFFFVLFLIGALSLVGFFVYTAMGMDDFSDTSLSLTTYFYYDEGEIMATRYQENRREVKLSEVSSYMRHAIVAVEDQRFYQHWGIDVAGVARAMTTNLREGRVSQGGSTITQQLVKNLFLTHDRTMERKAQEAILTVQLERKHSKNEILEKYLNTIYFGRGAYGIETASLAYFNKPAQQLSLAEASFLAGLPRRPNMGLEAAKNRQAVVLAKMEELGYITPTETEEALAEGLLFYDEPVDSSRGNRGSYHVDYILNTELPQILPEEKLDLLYSGGLNIYTTIDREMQLAAEQTFNENMPEPYRYDENGVPQPQGALLAMDPETGHIKALVGGRDYLNTNYNRAISARRSPGSSIKPFFYAAAIEYLDYTVVSEEVDERLELNIPGFDEPYVPRNYNGVYTDKHLTMREALATSNNIVAIKLNLALGPETMVEYLQRMGIQSQLRPVISLPLGADITVLEMTRAITPFANQGYLLEPSFVKKITNDQGKIIYENVDIVKKKVIDASITYLVTDMLKDVIRPGGTAPHITEILEGRPAAAKTGTGEDHKSAYTVGYTPDLVVSVYVGDDDHSYTLGSGQTGGKVAAPIWANFIKEALKDREPKDFPRPNNIITVEICPEAKILCNDLCSLEPREELFIRGTEPTETCGPNNCQYCEVDEPEWWQQPWFYWR